MAQISRNDLKRRGLKRFFNSFKYSIQGLCYAYKNEQSMLIHFIVSILGILMGFVFNVSHTEWAIIFIAIGVTLASELINTAIEATVDLITLEINPLAKIAKDCGSAATFVFSIIAGIIGIIIFVPKIFHLIF